MSPREVHCSCGTAVSHLSKDRGRQYIVCAHTLTRTHCLTLYLCLQLHTLTGAHTSVCNTHSALPGPHRPFSPPSSSLPSMPLRSLLHITLHILCVLGADVCSHPSNCTGHHPVPQLPWLVLTVPTPSNGYMGGESANTES